MESSGRAKSSLLITVMIYSVAFGVSGLEHGFFELLQGSTRPEGLLISAIGPADRFWSKGTETAFTLIPHMGLTGSVAMAFGAGVILWSVLALRRKHAWIVLLVLSVGQFLTGGGFAQIFLSIPTSILACRIGAPLSWWKSHLSERTRRYVAAPWSWLYWGFVVLFALAIESAVFGLPFGNTQPDLMYRIMTILSYMMLAVFALSVPSALAKESLET